MTLAPLGDSAVLATFGPAMDEATTRRVRAFVAALESQQSVGIVDIVPSYTTVAVFYEVVAPGTHAQSPYERVSQLLTDCMHRIEQQLQHEPIERGANADVRSELRTIEIPVCYGGEFGPDLEAVARHTGLDTSEVIRRHVGGHYEVYAVGFTPGFPYLGGLPAELATPRKATPRVQVAAGSVGIGGAQTGLYPVISPGGWQLIGRTPHRLFDVSQSPPAMLRVGDRVRFRAITQQEFPACE